MIKAALEYVAGLKRDGIAPIVIGDKHFSTTSLHEIKPERAILPRALELSTLDGVVEYVQSILMDDVEQNNNGLIPFIHVCGTAMVRVTSVLDEERRGVFAQATPISAAKVRDGYMDAESFVLMAMTGFAPSENREKILQLASGVKSEAVATSKDDGISQVATVQRGARAEHHTIVNPVSLAPYRTFPEIEQPESLYVVRVRIADHGPQIGLFGVEDGQWRLEAIKSIAEFLRLRLAGKNIEIIV